jgi:hypothetical protein
MGSSLPSCRKGERSSSLTWSKFFVSAWPLDVPPAWRQVKVFIPKPGRNTYCGPKDYRPISLTSFLLKTMERLVDRYLRDETLVSSLLHPNQHAYQARKSTETALHQLVV